MFRSAHRQNRFVGEYDELVAERRLATQGNQAATIELADVTRAIGSLLGDQQEALTFVAIDGLSYEEAAARCKTPIGTLKSRVARAIAGVLMPLLPNPLSRCHPDGPVRLTAHDFIHAHLIFSDRRSSSASPPSQNRAGRICTWDCHASRTVA